MLTTSPFNIFMNGALGVMKALIDHEAVHPHVEKLQRQIGLFQQDPVLSEAAHYLDKIRLGRGGAQSPDYHRQVMAAMRHAHGALTTYHERMTKRFDGEKLARLTHKLGRAHQVVYCGQAPTSTTLTNIRAISHPSMVRPDQKVVKLVKQLRAQADPFRESEVLQEVRPFLESFPEQAGIFRMSEEGVGLVMVNRRVEETSGYSEGQLTSLDFTQNIANEIRPMIGFMLEELVTKGFFYMPDVKLKRKEVPGQETEDVIVDTWASLIEGTMLGTFWLIDQSERNKAAGALREAHGKYMRLYAEREEFRQFLLHSGVPMSILTFGEDGKIQAVVKSFSLARMLGYLPEEAMDLVLREHIHPKDHGVLEELEMAFSLLGEEQAKSGVRPFSWTVDMIKRNRDIIPVDLKLSMGMVEGSGVERTPFAIAEFTDARERLQREEERRQREAAEQELKELATRDEVARGFADRMNNTLQKIGGLIEYALVYAGRAEPTIKMVIEQQLNQAGALIGATREEFQEFVDLGVGPRHLRARPIEMFLDQGDIESRIKEKLPNVEVELALKAKPSLIEVDMIMFHRIIVNLIENAAVAMAETEKPRIEIVTRNIKLTDEEALGLKGAPNVINAGHAEAGDFVSIIVRDNGSVLDADKIKEAFHFRFSYRADRPDLAIDAQEKREKNLWLVQSFMDKLKGFIKVETGDGETTFYLYLPAAQPDPK